MSNIPNIIDVIIQAFNNILTQFSAFFPKLICLVVVLGIGYLTSKGIVAVLTRVLDKIGFAEISENLNKIPFVKQFKIKINLAKIITAVVFYFMMLVFIIASADILGVLAISQMVLMVVSFIPKVVAAAIMMVGGIFIADFVRDFVVQLCKSFGIQSGRLIGSVFFFFLLMISIIASLGQAGINTSLLESTFNIIIGGVILAFSVGYGFASRHVLSNILASIYSRTKIKEGQIIEIEGVKGEVVALDNTTLTLKTGNSKTTFPLHTLQTKKVIFFEQEQV